MIKKIVIVALASALASVAFSASPAQAGDGKWGATSFILTPPQITYESQSNWRGVDTAGGPSWERSKSITSGVVDCATAVAAWEKQDSDTPTNGGGTSVETKNLGVEVDTGDVLGVGYALGGGASPAAGSVRFFAYMHPNADTFNEGPEYVAIAPDDGTTEGTLQFTINVPGTIGTAGVVYDTSNGGVDGQVVFTNLSLNSDVVSFTSGCVVEESPSPEPTPTEPEPSTSPSAEPTSPESTTTPDTTEVAGNLPKTSGLNLLPLFGIAAAVLFSLGGALVWVGRRKKVITE